MAIETQYINGKAQCVPRRVVVALRMAGVAGQDKLHGIFEYLNTRERWQLVIYRTRQEFTADTVREELGRRTDGFIVGIPDSDEALAVLAHSDVPTVAIDISGGGIENRKDNIAFVKNDPAAIGWTAAQALLSHGIYKSYGYAGYRTDDGWSRDRGDAFRDALDKAGFAVRMFDVRHYDDKITDNETVANWLKALPKPCGIFASCDDRAFEILDACNEIGIKVPDEIGIIGVNNDIMLCENADPSLTSIQPDFIREGLVAAELLECMMNGGRIQEQNLTAKIDLQKIVYRDSTISSVSSSGKLVQKALNFINKNALKGIGVEQVVKRFKVSRSLLELRFKELQHESIYEAILRIRLDEVCRRLEFTAEPISEITAACGWKNPIPPKILFKKRYKMSMSQYRASRRNRISDEHHVS